MSIHIANCHDSMWHEGRRSALQVTVAVLDFRLTLIYTSLLQPTRRLSSQGLLVLLSRSSLGLWSSFAASRRRC